MSKHILFDKNDDSSQLIVYFSSAGAKTFEGYSLLSKYSANKLFIRDDTKSWYSGTIPSISKSADDLIEYLKNIIEKFEKKNIVFLGSSMGAYAAILFGIKLNIGKVIAFSPQIILHPSMPFSPNKAVKYNDLSKLVLENQKTDIDIWFGEGEPLDLFHIHHITSAEKVSFFPVSGAPHNVLFYLKQNLVLIDLFDFYFSKKKIKYPLHNTDFMRQNNSHIEVIHSVVKKFYLDSNYGTLMQLNKPKRNPLVAANYLRGLIYMKKNLFEKAILEFKQALYLQPLNYDYSYNIALSYLKLGKASLAEPALKHAIKHYPAPSSQLYARLSEAQRVQGKIDKASENAQISLDIDKNNLWAHYQLGLIADRKKESESAIEHFSFILQTKPNWDVIKTLLSLQFEREIEKVNASYNTAKSTYNLLE